MRFIPLALLPFVLLYADTPAPTAYTIATVAGSSFVGDGGPATSAALSDAEGVAVDSLGNVYIADSNDHRVRKVAIDGTISTIAGDGFPGFLGDGGPAAAARLNTPYGIAVDTAGNLYIADLGNNRVRLVSPAGTITTVSGTDKLQAPRNVALDSAGNLYISEFGGAHVWMLGARGVLQNIAGTGVAGFGGDGGPATAAQLSFPAGLAFDSAGNLYIADSSNNRVRKIAGGIITTVLGTGNPGAALPNQLNLPTGVAVDSAGNLDVADSNNQRIQQLTPAGVINTLPGVGRDLAADATGDLFLASGGYVFELTSSLTQKTIAGDGSYSFRGDGGPATFARLNGPVAIAFDAAGVLYIADQKNLRVRTVNATGVISTIDGDGTAGFGNDELSFPGGVAVGQSGMVYIADQNNDRIQAILGSGNIVTIAGTSIPGFNGDGLPGAATQLFSPGAMAMGADGTVYFADKGNQRVRALRLDTTIVTLAQTPVSSVAIGASGNIYIADGPDHRILSIDQSGRAYAIAGTGTPGFAGDGGPALTAQFNSPGGIAADAHGNLYIADTGNNRIRVIGADGNIQTIAGTGAADFDGDGGPALAAVLNGPTGLLVDASGNIWVADSGNSRIREVSPASASASVASQEVAPLALVNAASMLTGPIAPGEIVAIFGLSIGPVAPVSSLSSVTPTVLGQTQVLFDGQPAPLFYVQDSEIMAQAPYEIAGKSTVDVEVLYQGQSCGTVTATVAASAPGIFTVSAGTGLASAGNQDGTLNSTFDPAPRGSIIALYATGEGITSPASADGQPAIAPYPPPALPVTVTIGGALAQILFAGEAPGFSGLLQINAVVPQNLAATGLVPVMLEIGAASSQTGVTIAVR
jgi:uncharacterized protein (TIGR03437 family)